MEDMTRLGIDYKWAKEFIHGFTEKCEFDPYAVLTGTENVDQKLYCLCIDFVVGLGSLCEKFEQDRTKIVFGK